MASIGHIISVAGSALRAGQTGISITGQNVANATTEGYSRQRAHFEAAPGLRLPQGTYGSGVSIRTIDRLRDIFLDDVYRVEQSKAEGSRARADLLLRVESLMGEPGEAGLSAVLDAFYSAWDELASSPESGAARSTLRQATEVLTFRMNDLAAGVDRIRQEAMERLQQNAARVQTLLGDIVSMNHSIIATEAGGKPAPDLRDSRDRALDELATLLPIQVRENEDGSIRVNVGGIGVVDGPKVHPVDIDTAGGTFSLTALGRTVHLDGVDGRIGGILQALNHDIPALREGLDEMARALVDSVNALHTQGTNPDGDEGVLFFHFPLDGNGDPIPVTASGIRLSDAVLASPLAIATGTGSDPGEPGNEPRPGVNDIALAIAALRDGDAAGLDASVSAYYGELVGNLANATRQARDGSQVHRILADQAELRRSEVNGVSIDEEMVKLIQFQAAYSAAARVLSAADEMLQTLLAI